MKEIVTKRGHRVQVSEEDYTRVAVYSWFIANTTGGKQYVVRTVRKRFVYLHRFLLDAKPGEFVDHINGDTLNNCRDNLRKCSRAQNAINQRKCSTSRATSRYKGVSYDKKTKKWRCRITLQHKTLNLGWFISEEEAAYAYDESAKTLFGEFARLNFPQTS